MRYRLAADINIQDLCGQTLRLQEIQDRNGNSIILAIGENHTAITLAYSIKPKRSQIKVSMAVSEKPTNLDGQSNDQKETSP